MSVRQIALAKLTERREISMQKGIIDNGFLPAGSPMFYYCVYCGTHCDTKPEDWWESLPKTTCIECQILIDGGWHDNIKPKFPYSNHKKINN